jgi:ribosome modulation factor
MELSKCGPEEHCCVNSSNYSYLFLSFFLSFFLIELPAPLKSFPMLLWVCQSLVSAEVCPWQVLPTPQNGALYPASDVYIHYLNSLCFSTSVVQISRERLKRARSKGREGITGRNHTTSMGYACVVFISTVTVLIVRNPFLQNYTIYCD